MVALTLSFLNLYTQYNRPQKNRKCESTTCTNVNAFVVPENEPTGSTEFTGATSINMNIYSIFLITDI